MHEYPLPIGRRGFLRASASGGILLAGLPLWHRSTSGYTHQPSPSPDSTDTGNDPAELERIVLKFGGEFGEIGREE